MHFQYTGHLDNDLFWEVRKAQVSRITLATVEGCCRHSVSKEPRGETRVLTEMRTERTRARGHLPSSGRTWGRTTLRGRRAPPDRVLEWQRLQLPMQTISPVQPANLGPAESKDRLKGTV